MNRLTKKDADRKYRDAANKVNKVMIEDLDLWSKGFAWWAKNTPCIRKRLSHDDGELAYFFRATADPNVTGWEAILAANGHRVDGPDRFLPGRGWETRATEAIRHHLEANLFHDDPEHWEKEVREQAVNAMEEDDMDEDEAIEIATERGKETYNNDGEAGIYICCELCSKYRDPDQNRDCRYNAWED